MADLKPCPFCGGKAAMDSTAWDHFVADTRYKVYVRCTKCNARTVAAESETTIEEGVPVFKKDGRPFAIEAWNRRHYMEFGGYIVPDELGGFYELEKEERQ